MKTFKFFTVFSFAFMVNTAIAEPTNQKIVKGDQGPNSVDLRKSDLCLSRDGVAFSRKNGEACQKGDLTYVHVAFDSDRAGDIAESLCDFNRERPSEAMDVYGVLCYAKGTPAFGKVDFGK